MKKARKKLYRKYMIRPMIHMAFIRSVLGLTAALLWNEFVNIESMLPMRTFAFLFLGAFFLLTGWMAYLRLDGMKAPAFDKRLFEWKRKPKHIFGDMIDYVGEDVISFDELDEDEKNFCRLTVDLLCGVVFLTLSCL